MCNSAVILAAGRGSRLGKITERRSKAMCPVAGVPMVERVLESFRVAGVTRFIIVAAPHDEELINFYHDRGEVTVVFQENPKGSAKALEVCAAHLEGRFFVTACDSLVPPTAIEQLREEVQSRGAAGGIGIMEVDATQSLQARSVVALDGCNIERIIEKPAVHERISNITSIPLYLLSENIFELLIELKPSVRGEYELPEALNAMVENGQVLIGARVSERLELTNANDLLSLNEVYLSRRKDDVDIHSKTEIDPSVILNAPVVIEEGCSIAKGCIVGPFVYVERNSRIASGCRLERSLILRDSTVNKDLIGDVIA